MINGAGLCFSIKQVKFKYIITFHTIYIENMYNMNTKEEIIIETYGKFNRPN